MASYVSLVALETASDPLHQQIKMAIAVTALNITAESAAVTNHAARLAWAKGALNNPDAEVARVFWYVLAANAAATVAQIQAATDAQVQANVEAAVALFI